MTVLVQNHTWLSFSFSSPLLLCSLILQMWGIPIYTTKWNTAQCIFIECLLFGRRNGVFSKHSGESYFSMLKKCTHNCILTDIYPACVSALCTQAWQHMGEKSHLLLQAMTITEKISCRKLANSISAGGPEILYQRFRDSRQHFTSFIQMLGASRITINHLTTCVLCLLTS